MTDEQRYALRRQAMMYGGCAWTEHADGTVTVHYGDQLEAHALTSRRVWCATLRGELFRAVADSR